MTPELIRDYGLMNDVSISKELPHTEEQPWRLICTLPHNAQVQPSTELGVFLGEEC